MSDEKSIYDGLPHIYAEQLKGKRVTLTIKKVESGAEFVSPDGRKAIGFNVSFVEIEKMLGITGVTVRRQMMAACGTENIDEMIGKRIILYAIKSMKSASGEAIRISKAEPIAKPVAQTAKGIIRDVAEADINGKIKYGIIMDSNVYGTFDKSIGDGAKVLTGEQACITWKQDGQHKTALSVVAMD